jgi:hypothetical protein
MVIRDLFSNWEGPGAMVSRNGATTLMLEGNAVPPDQGWFLRIVQATAEERKSLEEAGYVLKDA